MSIPLELTFRNFEDTGGAVEQVVHEKLAKLEKICPKMISCHVVIEQIQNPKHNHHSYSIHITITFPPHHEVVVFKDPHKGEPQDVLLTTQVRNAFITARRQVQAIMDRDRGRVKTHAKDEDAANEEELANEA
ncbi:MAG: HPF/RaiA family ribosome-associated protein [Candidatus Omnitrophota bacterium]